MNTSLHLLVDLNFLTMSQQVEMKGTPPACKTQFPDRALGTSNVNRGAVCSLRGSEEEEEEDVMEFTLNAAGQRVKTRNVTCKQFYAYRMHTRPAALSFNTILRWGRLAQVHPKYVQTEARLL